MKADRAKQFLPFDALKGLQAALREKEQEAENEDRKELSEEMYGELEIEFNKLEIGNVAKIIHYKNKRYITTIGYITGIDYNKNKVQIDGENINSTDILEITIA